MLSSHDFELTGAFSEKLTELFRQYLFVGGMPEVVDEFVRNNDIGNVRSLQTAILDAYRNDISKHTTKPESIRIGQVLSSLPSQLARENKKFIYGAAKAGARAADFEMAIQWLIDAGIVFKANRVKKAAMPLKLYEDISAFKLFLLDVGLLGCMADVPPNFILFENKSLEEYKGMMSEEYIAQQIFSAGINLYYWSNDKTPAELDFLIQRNDRVYPIEVKASKNVRGKSIAQFVKDNPDLRGIRYSLLDYMDQGWIVNYPLYAAPFSLVQNSSELDPLSKNH